MKNRQMRLGIALIIIVIAIGVFASQIVQQQNEVNYRERVSRNAEFRALSIIHKMHDYETIVLSIRQLFYASDFVTRGEFNIFVQPILERHDEIQAIEWIPKVPHELRGIYVQKARQEGLTDFDFTALVDGEMVVSRENPVYFPVYYVLPYEGNEAVAGFDLASNTSRSESLIYARDTKDVVITEPIRLVQDTGEGFGFLMLYAVEKSGQLEGFVNIVYEFEDYIEKSLSVHEEIGLEMLLVDTTHGEQQVVYTTAMNNSVESSVAVDARYIEKIDVGGREWTLIFIPSQEYEQSFLSKSSYLILAITGVIASLLGIYLLSINGYERQLEYRIEEQVEEIQNGQRRLQIALEGAGQAIWTWDLRSNRTTMGDNWINLVGYSREELNRMDEPWKVLIHPIDYQRIQDIISRFLEEGSGVYHSEYRMIKKDGTVGWFYDEGRFFDYDDKGSPGKCAGTVHDVTEIVHLREELKQKAIVDQLTGLYNRRYLFEQLEQYFSLHMRHGQQYSLVIIDIDYFKKVNDTYGHQVGDFVLNHFSTFLKENVRTTDLVARYGGEEFVVVFHEVSLLDASETIDRMRMEIEQMIVRYENLELRYTFSAGVVNFEEVESLDEVVSLADERLYGAKETGRNKVVHD